MAQQVISEPGYCAFFYPNANCQNKGPGNPYTDPNYERGTLTSTADRRREIGGIIAAPTRLRGNLPGP